MSHTTRQLNKIYSNKKNQPSKGYMQKLKRVQAKAVKTKMFKVTCTITANTKQDILKELKFMIDFIQTEMYSTTCKSCRECKAPKGICIISGGTSDGDLESVWKLHRRQT